MSFFEKYKIGRKIQALSKAIILCHRLTSAFPFLPKLASGSGFLREEKKLASWRKILVGFGNTTNPTPVHLSLLDRGGWLLSWRGPLVLSGLCQRRSQRLGGGWRVGCSGRSLGAGGEGQGACEKGDELLGAARPAQWPLAWSPLGPGGWASVCSAAGCGEAPFLPHSI